MADRTLNIALAEDRASVALTFTAEKDAVVMSATPTQLDAIIQGLATARAQLSPPIPTTHAGAPIQAAVPAQAVIPAERIGDRRLIIFRHPGFGWLSFELTGSAVSDLAVGILAAMQSHRAAGKI